MCRSRRFRCWLLRPASHSPPLRGAARRGAVKRGSEFRLVCRRKKQRVFRGCFLNFGYPGNPPLVRMQGTCIRVQNMHYECKSLHCEFKSLHCECKICIASANEKITSWIVHRTCTRVHCKTYIASAKTCIASANIILPMRKGARHNSRFIRV